MQSLLLRAILLTVCSFGPFAYAETTGWSWGPFASSTTHSEVGVTSRASSSWLPQWKMPDITRSVKKATKSVTDTTTNAWNSASRTTKRAWKKTADFLDPFPDDPKSSLSSSKSSSSGSSWFGGSKKDEKPATVQEFLRQERP